MLVRWIHAAVLLTLGMPTLLSAQTVSGQVLEEGRDSPVPGALVSLVDRDGERRAEAWSDSLGRFAVAPPREGEYVMEVVRLGYETFRSPFFAMGTEGVVQMDLMVSPLPIGLEGLEVTVETQAIRTLRSYGQSPATLGPRWIDREKISEVASAIRTGDVLRWQSMPGVQVPTFNGSPNLAPLCVKVMQGYRSPCALTVLNGMVVDPLEANQLDPDAIESMAVLTPSEATLVFGTRGGAGAVLIWLR